MLMIMEKRHVQKPDKIPTILARIIVDSVCVCVF